MRLALAIVFLWLGGVLLFVAFHPMEDSIRTPGDAVNAVREDIGKTDSAWSL